jgi:hypothetical protein
MKSEFHNTIQRQTHASDFLIIMFTKSIGLDCCTVFATLALAILLEANLARKVTRRYISPPKPAFLSKNTHFLL